MTGTITAPPRTPVPGIGRRTLVKGAAWSVPVVALAAPAPAFAASCTQLYSGTLDWGNAASYNSSTTSSGNATIAFDNGTTTKLTLSSTFAGYTAATTNAVPDAIPNLSATRTSVGGTNAKGLVLCQTCNATGNLSNSNQNQTVTFSFDRSVYNVRFMITDLDSTASQFWDTAAITGATFTQSKPAGSTVIGVGAKSNTVTNANVGPFRPTDDDTAFDNATGVGGNVSITIPGPITAFSLVYWNRQSTFTATSKQTLYVSSLTAQVHNANCNP